MDQNGTFPQFTPSTQQFNSSLPPYDSSLPSFSPNNQPSFNTNAPNQFSTTLPQFSANVPQYTTTFPQYNSTLPPYDSTIPQFGTPPSFTPLTFPQNSISPSPRQSTFNVVKTPTPKNITPKNEFKAETMRASLIPVQGQASSQFSDGINTRVSISGVNYKVIGQQAPTVVTPKQQEVVYKEVIKEVPKIVYQNVPVQANYEPYEREIQNLQNINKQFNDQNKQLNDANKQLAEQNRQLTEQLRQLGAQNHQLNEDNVILHQQLEDLKNENEQGRNKIKETEQIKRTAKTTQSQLQQQLNDLQMQNNDLKGIVSQNEDRVAHLLEEMENWRERYNQKEQEIDAFKTNYEQQRRQSYEKEIKDLTQKFLQERQIIDSENHDLSDQNNILRVQLSKAEANIKNAAQLVQDNKQLKAELDDLKGKQTPIEDALKNYKIMDKQNKQLRDDLEEYQKRYNKLMLIVEEKNKEIEELKKLQKLAPVKENTESVKRAGKGNTEELDQLRIENEKLKEDNGLMFRELQELQQSHHLIEELQNKNSDLEKRLLQSEQDNKKLRDLLKQAGQSNNAWCC